MSIKPVLLACCVLPLLAGCASYDSMESAASGNGMLVIGAQLNPMNPSGDTYGNPYVLNAISVKNLDTGQVYGMVLDANHAIAELPAGTYCIYSLKPENSSPLVYCGKPYFALTPHKITVTGYFYFGMDYSDNTYTLNRAFVDKQGLFNRLSKAEVKTLENFDAGNS